MILRLLMMTLAMMLSSFNLESIHEGSINERVELLEVSMKEVLISQTTQLAKTPKSQPSTQCHQPGFLKPDTFYSSFVTVNRDLFFKHRQLLI